MKLLVADGDRRSRLSGYGALSRGLTFALADLGHEVCLPATWRTESWGEIESGSRERLEAMPRATVDEVDLVLQIGSPLSCRRYPQPSLIYTQNALGDLRSDWIEAVSHADGVIVPSEFDRRVFKRYFDRVYVARQSSNADVFKPRPQSREEGSDLFSFLFVGGYGYRKGVDLLLEAFLNEFDPSERVELVLQCAGSGRGNHFNHLLENVQRINPMGRVRLFGSPRSPAWMCRLYNKSDCLITLSRGEGWCMPVTEALLCELPVIAPNSTAMAEYLSPEIASLVPVREREISAISDPFGHPLATFYGKPGNVLYEPDIHAAREAMREVVTDPESAREKARRGGRYVREQLSWRHAGEQVESACLDLLGASAPTAP